MESHESGSSQADERLYAHYGSMEDAFARSLVMARQQVAAVVAVVGGWRPRRVLDISAGAGAMLRLFGEQGFAEEYAATDISRLSVDFVYRHSFPGFTSAVKASVEGLPYEDRSFDLALLSHVLEHVPDPIIALEEASRVASKVCLEVPLELALLPTAKAAWLALARGRIRSINRIGHVHFFSVRAVRDLIHTAGLEIEAEFRYRLGFEWLSMHYGRDSLNTRIRETLGSLLPIVIYGFFLSTHFTVLCSSASARR